MSFLRGQAKKLFGPIGTKQNLQSIGRLGQVVSCSVKYFFRKFPHFLEYLLIVKKYYFRIYRTCKSATQSRSLFHVFLSLQNSQPLDIPIFITLIFIKKVPLNLLIFYILICFFFPSKVIWAIDFNIVYKFFCN